MSRDYQNLEQLPLAGEWRNGRAGRTLEVVDPFDQSSLLSIPMANAEDLDASYRRARDVQPDWALTPASERAGVMQKVVELMDERREELLGWLIRESGSTRLKAQAELAAARAITLESAAMANRVAGMVMEAQVPGKESRVFRKPLGVIGIISPWNFPLHLTQRSLAPALALGNSVVIKPASDTPLTGGLLLARLFEEAGLPAGVLSVVVGAGSEIGDAFVDHEVPRLISFTGSTQVGKGIGSRAVGGDHLKQVALELGGNSPFVVLDDANIEQAVDAALVGKFLHQGQICMAINRIIVDASVHDAFVDRFVARARELKVGNPAQDDTVIGPIINAKQRDGLLEMIETAKGEGAKVMLEGEAQGQLVPPHVFTDVTNDMSLAQNEIFGPVVGIQKARDEAHALELANGTEYGLSASVFTADIARGERFARQVEAGMVHVNDMPVNDDPRAPFGGEKNSGLGRFNGDWVLEEFTTDQWVSLQVEPRQYPF
ncbi:MULTISPECIES: aldehyde dehydrogenase family protein [Cobetia]|uniref:aldehyde dehydrogenase family protein n=1 Tax=Cobetia TaxID=204286 RepID=UPI00086559FC|nr:MULTISPECIES: aldehyde dehydrogenase family protein [Cobetia]AOM01547.1 aldehyde dehydrogenase [Cobetia marina]AZV31458.1 aldehyde dehydrogenase [Cobetia sp. ICG0124]